MRVDFVITELEVGGAEKCLTEIAVGLADSGDTVRVFSIAPLPSGNQSQLVDRLRSRGIELASGEATRSRGILAAAKRLSAFLERSPPQVCQTFLFHANVLGTWVAKRHRVPIVVGGLRVAEHRRFRCSIEAMAVRKMDHLVCVSQAVADFAHQRLKCSPDRLTVIPNGVDTQRFATGTVHDVGTLGWPDDTELILFVGRLHPQKGLDLIQAQIDRLVPAGSNRRLLLVGDGVLRPSMDRWCRAIGAPRAQLLPWQSDVAPLIRRCNLLVLPSRYEGMPNVVLEAMAAGRPVVCSQVEGTRELFGDDVEQTFPVGDHAAMADRIDHILNSPELARTLGQKNASKVKRDFSIPAMIDAYRHHYRKLVRQNLD